MAKVGGEKRAECTSVVKEKNGGKRRMERREDREEKER